MAKENSGKPRHVYLIDGSGFIFRAYHALPPMTRDDGTPVNAVYGFCSMLMKLLQDAETDDFAVIFDAGRKSFRNDIYPDYKAHRPPPPEDLVPQFELIRDAVRAFNLPAVQMAGYEADDLIATYARQAAAAGNEVTIVSSDKDLMQLVDGGIRMMDPMKLQMIGPEEVRTRFGVDPDKVVEVQALAGDATDNVPGVPGIGVKTAAQLIEAYGDVENLLAHAEEIKQPKRRQSLLDNAELARLSRQLVELKDDVPVEEPLDSFELNPPDPEVLLGFLREQGFKSLTARIGSRICADGDTDAAEASAPAANGGYELVQDEAALQAWVERALEAGTVAVDTETTSLDSMRAELVGVSLWIESVGACYIPVGHVNGAAQGDLGLGDEGANGQANGETPPQIDRTRALELLGPMLADRSVLKVGHNIKYDMEVLGRYGAPVTPIDDTMVLSYVLDGTTHGHGMDELALIHFDHDTIKFKDVAGSGRNQVTFDKVPLDKALDYAAEDAEITGRLHRLLKPRLVGAHMVTIYETIERPLIGVLRDMETAGIKVDHAALAGLSRDFAQRLGGLEDEIHKLVGHEFNVGSPKQLGEVLFDEMGLKGGKRGKTGAYSTSADVLEDLAAQVLKQRKVVP